MTKLRMLYAKLFEPDVVSTIDRKALKMNYKMKIFKSVSKRNTLFVYISGVGTPHC